jgi:SAM-dependent methyltransferase
MITLAKRTWPDMRPILHVCDAINLHLWRDGTFDAIHSAQSAEHWRPDHVPLILQELRRVTKPGGLLWVSLDTQELYDRQNRDPASEDATHICVKPRAWWSEQLAIAGWSECTEGVRPAMSDRGDSFFMLYDWDWFAARKPE